MGRIICGIATGFCSLFMTLGCGSIGDAPPPSVPFPREVAEIEALLKQQNEAWNRGDLDGFMAGYWDSPDLEFVSGTTTTKGFQPTKERYFKRYRAEGMEMGALRFSEIATTVDGGAYATTTGKWKVEMSKGTSSGRFTLQLRSFKDGWKIVNDVTTSDDPPKKE